MARAIATMTAHPEVPVGAVALADEPALPKSMPDTWAGGVYARFEARVREAAHEPALIVGDESLSYGELSARAALVAGALKAAGVAPGHVVAMHLERGADVAIAIAGILRAGAAYEAVRSAEVPKPSVAPWSPG